MIWVKLALVGGVIAAFLYIVHAYNSAITDAESAEQKLEAVTKEKDAEIKKIGGERDGWIDVAAERAAAAQRYEQTIVEREKERARLQRERDDARTSLAELLRRPDVKPWADTELPPAVAERLRGAAGGGVASAAATTEKGAAAGKPDGGDAGAGVRR